MNSDLQFSDDEDDVLYFVDGPNPPYSCVGSIVTAWCHVFRCEPPEYAVVKSALDKALQAGFLQLAPEKANGETRFYLLAEAHSLIHADQSGYAVYDRNRFLPSKVWIAQNDATFPLTENEYRRLADAHRRLIKGIIDAALKRWA